MKLTELIEKLGEIRLDMEDSGIDPDKIDVMVGIQPTYPLTSAVLGVISGEELWDHCENGIGMSDKDREAVWIATDLVGGYRGYSGYAPRPLWEAIS